MTCTRCDGSGRVPGDPELGTFTDPCPVCVSTIDGYRTEALMLAVRAIGDALAERAIAAMRCDCGGPLDVPASRCSACERRALMKVVQ